MNFLYGNNTQTDLSIFHDAIVESLTRDGTLPVELADLLTVVRVDPAFGNPDGSPRFMINAAEVLTESQSRGLGALAARTQMRAIERAARRELNRAAAWCADREKFIARGVDFDAWHDGWASEMVEVQS